jgi:hypothetical protein
VWRAKFKIFHWMDVEAPSKPPLELLQLLDVRRKPRRQQQQQKKNRNRYS